MRMLASLLTFALLTFSAHAQQAWQIEKLDASLLPVEIVPDTRKIAPNGLPDGRIAVGGRGASIQQAWYSEPTERYPHGILGDVLEGGGLVVVTQDGTTLRYSLPQSDVFEDITPYLADLDGDGETEVITIQSNQNAGAALAIYQVKDGKLMLRTRNEYIGLSNRWLNISGISRYLGKSTLQIAIVVTPHIGGRLDLYEFSNGQLVRIASKQGFSNHEINSPEQRLSASYMSGDGKKDNLAVPSADRKTLYIMSASLDGWRQVGSAELPFAIDKAIAMEGSGGKLKFIVGLSDGSVYSVFR